MESAKNLSWNIPFKKIGTVRVNMRDCDNFINIVQYYPRKLTKYLVAAYLIRRDYFFKSYFLPIYICTFYVDEHAAYLKRIDTITNLGNFISHAFIL